MAPLKREALKAQPSAGQKSTTDTGALRTLARERLDSGDAGQAVKYLRRGARLDRRSADVRRELAGALVAAGDVRGAISAYRDAAKLDPGHVPTWIKLGGLLHTIGRRDEAIKCYRKATALSPAAFDAHNDLGVALREEGRFEEALASFGAAVSVNTSNAIAQSNLGSMRLEQGDIAGAREAFEAAVKSAPHSGRYHYHLSQVKTFQAGDPQIPTLRELVADAANVAPHEHVGLHFALAKALADTGGHAESFQNLALANGLKRRTLNYEEGTILVRSRPFRPDTRPK